MSTPATPASSAYVAPSFAPDDLTKSSTPRQRWALARVLIPKRMQPYLRGLRKRVEMRRAKNLVEPFRTVYPYTQVNHTRQRNLVRLAETIERENVPGACVECGVLDGGAAALVAHATRQSGRAIHLFDAWEGMPAATQEDGPDAGRWEGQIVGSPRRVGAVMREMRIDPARIHIHRGWFHETFPRTDGVTPVAFIHVDCDFYEPTKLCLAHWWRRLSPGGFVQFDDYASFRGCRQAVDEFLAAHPETSLELFGELKAKAFYLRKPLA